LLLVDLALDDAGEIVSDGIATIRAERDRSPSEREQRAGWADDWRHGQEVGIGSARWTIARP
jgi:hypothetical protein